MLEAVVLWWTSSLLSSLSHVPPPDYPDCELLEAFPRWAVWLLRNAFGVYIKTTKMCAEVTVGGY